MLSKEGYIASQRFGMGHKHSEQSRVSSAPRDWLRKQVEAGQETVLKHNSPPTKEIVRTLIRAKKPRDMRKDFRQRARAIYDAEMQARFELALSTNQPFIERLVQFWSNHFTVSFAGKFFLSSIVGAYEREVVRPHVLGKFSDMLIASAKHPAMLIYLDNINSIGANAEQKRGKNTGLNENLAREILELHTLGVNGGYAQKDVIALANIITGWTLSGSKKNGGGFVFSKKHHEPGNFVLLGKTYTQEGQGQGMAALRDIASHPSTARFVATKLVRHFVDDVPPERAIKEIEATFLKSNGDLKAVALALINLREAWQQPMTKIKTPYEMIVSSLRLVGTKNHRFPLKRVKSSLKTFDHIPFKATSPAGRSDIAADWISPNAMINRVEWCQVFSQYVSLKENPLTLAHNHLGAVAAPSTLTWIERAPTAKDGLALLLASPEWQRR